MTHVKAEDSRERGDRPRELRARRERRGARAERVNAKAVFVVVDRERIDYASS